ncbi:MAG: YbaB/EbfC family nucleoid-associated protein [Oligoflexia bacterium]|nr:YbaB/EbfC family nucleoid-associated protein [Oligoflexia bacterium]
MPGFDPNDLGGLMAGFQQQVERLQQEAAATQVQGQAGGGLVTVVANGGQEILSVKIQDAALDDRELLEDLVVAATNDALRLGKEVMASKVGALTGGMGLPPGLLG